MQIETRFELIRVLVRSIAYTVSVAACALAPALAGAQVPIPALDHFTLYDASGTLDPPLVTIQDQFQIQEIDLGPTSLFLVPANKNNEGILDIESHLTCYVAQGPAPTPPVVRATHQFGEHVLGLGPMRYLCTPTEKFPPGQISIDHYSCYQATGPTLAVGAVFVDQFYAWQVGNLTPTLFCAPARKNQEPIQDPLSHLTCYDAQPPGPPVGNVPIRNQFGLDTLTIYQRRGVCLPSTKEVPPPGVLDHFVYYRATGPDAPPITIGDQFRFPYPVDLGPVVSFLVPADKNHEGIVDRVSHLTGYPLQGQSGLPQVLVTNQFFPVNPQHLLLGPARELFVPTEKLIPGSEGQPSIDHFLCYEATGTNADVGVLIADQFHPHPNPQTRLVQQPFLFCNPANKNGERYVDFVDHLTCYMTSPVGLPVGRVPIRNQFTPPVPDLIDVFFDTALCVPSKKFGADTDADGVNDLVDNCTIVPNPSQTDADGDGCGNECDGDFNNTGLTNIADFAIFKACFGRIVGPGGPADDTLCAESDMNNSSVVNIGDFALFKTEFSTGGGIPGPSGSPTRAGPPSCP
jgi:hypothetical protein